MTMPASRGPDPRDEQILADRITALNKIKGPRCGDYVKFTCGTIRRISHLWLGDSAQTSDAGRYYLGHDGISFSGSLYSSVPITSLTLTTETRLGLVWFFHHDIPRAHNAVHFGAMFRVYDCSAPATDAAQPNYRGPQATYAN